LRTRRETGPGQQRRHVVGADAHDHTIALVNALIVLDAEHIRGRRRDDAAEPQRLGGGGLVRGR
jgi:hypothetical protein